MLNIICSTEVKDFAKTTLLVHREMIIKEVKVRGLLWNIFSYSFVPRPVNELYRSKNTKLF